MGKVILKKGIRYSLVFGWIGVVATFLAGCASMEESYRDARRLDTISAYEEFVNRYPDSPYTLEARERFYTLKEEKAFEEVELKNSVIAYREFIQKYPNSIFIEEAKERTTESDEEALRRTYRIETIQAYQGFIESYPKSDNLPLARARIDFLKAVEPATLESYKRFITEYPNNPFVFEAKATFPILWLKEREKIGVLIDISKMESWRGIFRGGRMTEEKVHQKVFDGVKKDLEKERTQAVLLDDLNDPKVKEIQTMLVMEYEEQEQEEKQKPYSSSGPTAPGLGGYTTKSLNDAAVDNLSSVFSDLGSGISWLLTGPRINISSSITIKDVNTGLEYYSNLLNLNSKVERVHMVTALESFRERAIPSLAIALNDEDLIVRREAAWVLGKIKDKQTVKPLIASLKDEDRVVRRYAAEALGEIKDPKTVEPLVAALKDEDKDVRWEAALALGKIKDPKAVEPLIVILKEGEWSVQIEAAKALGKLGDARAVEPLTAALKEGSWEVRLEAAEALKNLTGKDFNLNEVEKPAVPCEDECMILSKKGQLRRGTTVDECIKLMCKNE